MQVWVEMSSKRNPKKNKFSTKHIFFPSVKNQKEFIYASYWPNIQHPTNIRLWFLTFLTKWKKKIEKENEA